MTDQTPRTEASLSLLRRPARAWPKGHDEWAETLAIIEAQARTEALEAAVERVEALGWTVTGQNGYVEVGHAMNQLRDLRDRAIRAILAGETE